MPYTTEWTEPDLFLEHNGVKVYHTYKDDHVDQGLMHYGFTLNEYDDEEHFDVRDLKTWGHDDDVRKALILAIESGELQSPDA